MQTVGKIATVILCQVHQNVEGLLPLKRDIIFSFQIGSLLLMLLLPNMPIM